MNAIRPMQEPDEIDQVLREFFQGELPQPWPRLRLPEEGSEARGNSAKKPVVRNWFSSRFALAASILLLLGGSLWLAGAFRNEKGANRSGSHKDVATKPKFAPVDVPAPSR